MTKYNCPRCKGIYDDEYGNFVCPLCLERQAEYLQGKQWGDDETDVA